MKSNVSAGGPYGLTISYLHPETNSWEKIVDTVDLTTSIRNSSEGTGTCILYSSLVCRYESLGESTELPHSYFDAICSSYSSICLLDGSFPG